MNRDEAMALALDYKHDLEEIDRIKFRIMGNFGVINKTDMNETVCRYLAADDRWQAACKFETETKERVARLNEYLKLKGW